MTDRSGVLTQDEIDQLLDAINARLDGSTWFPALRLGGRG